MNYLEELYFAWNENGEESKELNTALDKLCGNDDRKQEILLICTSAERQIAFKAGFMAAVQLIGAREDPAYPGEEWRKIENFPNYSVSSYGRVKNDITGCIKAQAIAPNGYAKVSLANEQAKGGKLYLVHRLVAQAFLPNPQNKSVVNHINRIREDNRLENLEWATSHENMQHAVRENPGLKTILLHNAEKARQKNCKPVLMYKNGEFVQEFESIADAANFIGVSRHAISDRIKHHRVIDDIEFRLKKIKKMQL